MQLPEWGTLVIELEQCGFSEVLYFELACKCGDWRSAFQRGSGFRPACPRCGNPGDFAILGRGLVQNSEIAWVCVSKRLPASHKIYREDAVPEPRTSDRRPKFYERAQRELIEPPILETRIFEPAELKTRSFEPSQPKAKAPRATPAEMKRRISLVAELLSQGLPQKEIAERTGLTDVKVLIHRNKAAIEAEMGRFRVTPQDIGLQLEATPSPLH